MIKENEPFPIRLKRALPWATLGLTSDMNVKEVMAKSVLDSVSWIGLISIAVGPIEWTRFASMAFFTSNIIKYRWMRSYFENKK